MTPCDEWNGHRNPKGYGRRSIGGRLVLTHREAWEAAHGPVPPGKRVLHRCDNPPCRNVEHLFLGTDADNAADRASKGRNGARLHGESNPGAKLSARKARDIRANYALCRVSQMTLAKRYGVAKSLIWMVIQGKAWTA